MRFSLLIKRMQVNASSPTDPSPTNAHSVSVRLFPATEALYWVYWVYRVYWLYSIWPSPHFDTYPFIYSLSYPPLIFSSPISPCLFFPICSFLLFTHLLLTSSQISLPCLYQSITRASSRNVFESSNLPPITRATRQAGRRHWNVARVASSDATKPIYPSFASPSGLLCHQFLRPAPQSLSSYGTDYCYV